ncbi:MAG TPA: hypothetical protein VJL83_00115 [Patescibacteria group bacterium]|nr:hypothetical protein [Patescibacteria group bacterium]
MKKIEIIWREILTETIERRILKFQQQELAKKFDLSTSTIHHALTKPRAVGAVAVHGRGFEVTDMEKLLMLWATERSVQKDVIYRISVDLPVLEIEGLLPGSVIPTAYTAYRFRYHDRPADYDIVYCYSDKPEDVARRFDSDSRGQPNLIILSPDRHLREYTPCPPLPQLFVDLWNLPQWYARDYQQAILAKIHASFGG